MSFHFSSPLFSKSKFVYQQGYKLYREGLIAVEAPAGSGKTSGTLEIIASEPQKFGPTLFIFPTVLAMQCLFKEKYKNTHICARYAQNALPLVALHISKYKTVVVDEAHFCSKEYFMIYQLLRNFKRDGRIILLSPIIDKFYFEKIFCRSLYYITVPPSYGDHFNRFIHYREHYNAGFINFKILGKEIMNVLEDYFVDYYHIKENKILCFLATPDQCEQMKIKIQGVYSAYTVLTLHGQHTLEQMEITRNRIRNETKCICLTTYIMETSVTILGINVVVDSGIQSWERENNLMLQNCDQLTMEQRAGRTGRTCDGVVYRIMSTLFYDHRPPIKYPKFNLDRILLFLFNLGLPTSVINQKLVKSTMEKIKPFRSNPKVLSFFWECQLELKNGLLLYECFQNIKKYPTALDIFKVWIIAIINVFDRQKINICYVTKNMIRSFKFYQILYD